MHRSVAGLVLLDKGHDFGVELVRPLGAARLGQQACQAFARECRLGLIKRRARHTEQSGGLGFGGVLDPYLAQHLVFGLDQIAGIEELVRAE